MIAGTLDRRVQLQQEVVTRDEYGAEVRTWLTVATIWASKREALGVEKFVADQAAQAEGLSTWRIRYRSGVQAKMRLVDDQEQAWDIQGLAEIGRREGLELRCARVVA